MFQEADGDALVGRTVAQLLFTADEFDVLPPHFSIDILTKLQEYGWDNILPGYAHYNDSFKRVCPFSWLSWYTTIIPVLCIIYCQEVIHYFATESLLT